MALLSGMIPLNYVDLNPPPHSDRVDEEGLTASLASGSHVEAHRRSFVVDVVLLNPPARSGPTLLGL